MVNDTLNPYASPAVPTEPGPEYEHRTLCASIEVDDELQRDAARGYRIRHALLLASTLLTIPLFSLPLLFFTDWRYAIAGGFIGGAPVSIALHVVLDWSIFFHNLRQLRNHPVLGAVGTWRIQIDEERIIIATTRGQQEWLLDDVQRMELSQRPIVLWLERDLAIALPDDGDYFEDDYPAFRKTLRRRIMHVGGGLVSFSGGRSTAPSRVAK